MCLWNIQGLVKKLCDLDFLQSINHYDVIFLTETWCNKHSNIKINGYTEFSCPRPKSSRRARRDSGGLVIYCKNPIAEGVKLIKSNDKGIMWVKFDKMFFSLERDTFFCLTYIPPEKSKLYSNITLLENFDFFDCISDDIRYFSYYGDVYLCGDLNGRTGCLSDTVEDMGLDRYVDLPEPDSPTTSIPPRHSFDQAVNGFGHKLISLCKEHDMKIVNGRLEPGRFTYMSSCGSSVVDYIITQTCNYSNIMSLNVADLSVLSDHCAVEICFKFSWRASHSTKVQDKILWDSSKKECLLNLLERKRTLFDNAIRSNCTCTADIDNQVSALTELIYDACFTEFGKTVTVRSRKPPEGVKKAPWFNEECRAAKAEFLNAKRGFKHNESSLSGRNKLFDSKKKYSFAKRKAKRKYEQSERCKFANMGKNSPKTFKKHVNNLRKGHCSVDDSVSIEQFAEHFKNLSNNSTNQNFEFDIDDFETEIEELDKEISLDEIKKVIMSLKRGKSPGFDGIVSDFFIDAEDFIAPYLLQVYNQIFNNAIYPESWTQGLIVPIHKKGDKGDPNNYRGITLISTVAKIFSLILRNRLNKWCEKEHVFNEYQFGFRNERSTADCIFILHSLIQKTLNENCKLYCAFVDYEKAFDTVIRDALWFKLVDSGVSCKMIKMVRSLYRRVLAAIKINADISDYFEISLGVKQGEPLSPLLFILFINDVYADFTGNGTETNVSGVSLNQLCIILLLFADDMVLFSKDPNELQLLLSKLYRYSLEWGLKVNTAKTKILVFEKRRSNNDFQWTYNGEILEIVESFCYLGFKFYYTGSLEPGVKALSDQALKATNCLLALFKRISF